MPIGLSGYRRFLRHGIPARSGSIAVYQWRDAAGVPSSVWSIDSEAGAVSDAVEATGSLDDARYLATHTAAKARRHSRGDRAIDWRAASDSLRLASKAGQTKPTGKLWRGILLNG